MSPPDAPSAIAVVVRRRARTRPALIAAGLKLLAERPIDSMSIDEIVEAAQVAKGSFFYHFADKHSFAREIAATVRVEIEATIADVNAHIDDPALRVARGIGQVMRFALDCPDKATIILSADRQSADPRHALNAGLRSDIERGVQARRFDCPDIDAAMLNLIGVSHLMIGKVLLDRLDRRQSRDLFRSVLAFAFRGLGLSVEDSGRVLGAVASELLAD